MARHRVVMTIRNDLGQELGWRGGTDQPVRNGDGRFHAEQCRQAVRTADAGSIAGSGASPQDEVRAASSGLRVRLVSNVVSFAWVRGASAETQPSRSAQVADGCGHR